jgi:hypothetical protein
MNSRGDFAIRWSEHSGQPIMAEHECSAHQPVDDGVLLITSPDFRGPTWVFASLLGNETSKWIRIFFCPFCGEELGGRDALSRVAR